MVVVFRPAGANVGPERNMEAALLKLLGLALAHVALARRRQRVMLLMVDGNDVIESCLRRDPIATAKVVSETIEAFWTALKDGPIPDDQLTSHVDAMSDLIKSAGGCPNGCATT